MPTPSAPFRSQLLKWIGNKQRQAGAIIACFPPRFGTYFEPFLGSGGVLGVLSPARAIASDGFLPLAWKSGVAFSVREKHWKQSYADRYALIAGLGKKQAYEQVRRSYNTRPNGADLVFLCRACYGGVPPCVSANRTDTQSTPVGIHDPIPPQNFAARVDAWHARTRGTVFHHLDFAAAMSLAKRDDMIYCDPPYTDSQTILYGAQSFSLNRLFESIALCKARGARVALSIDGTKFSGAKASAPFPLPEGLFVRVEQFIAVGRSMLKRFQMDGRTLEEHGGQRPVCC